MALALAACGRRESPAPSAASSGSAAQSAKSSPASAGEPRKVVKADGFSLTEQADGQVRIDTTDLWNGKLATTYADCGYFEKAVPVLERQLTPERGSKLREVCFHKKP